MKLNKKAVFFDLDHTLWDFEKNSALTFKELFSKYNISVCFDSFLEQYVPINIEYWKLFRDNEITREELRYGRFRKAFDSVGYGIEDETIFLLSEDYVECLPKYNHLYEGTIEVLEYLKTKYTLHIITNGFDRVQEGKLKNANIHHYFTTITNSENAGCKKPDARIFEYALQTAKADKETSIMIGDCIEADVQGAINYGMDAIYFNEHRVEVCSTISQIHNLLQLKDLL